jgi:polyferredoxin
MYYTIFILTLLDVALTTIGLRSGYVIEANPLMAYLISLSLPMAMIGVLVFTVLALILIHYFEREYKWVRYGLWVVLASKVIAMIFHGLWILNIRW